MERKTATLLTSQGHFSQIPESKMTVARARDILAPVTKYIQYMEKAVTFQQASGRPTDDTVQCVKALRQLDQKILAISNGLEQQTTQEVTEEETHSNRFSM